MSAEDEVVRLKAALLKANQVRNDAVKKAAQALVQIRELTEQVQELQGKVDDLTRKLEEKQKPKKEKIVKPPEPEGTDEPGT
jgi:tetrahydromethanopterin S-methyltransferase subunit B